MNRTIHHYKLEESLGAGGMGEVYRAEDTRLGRQVAIKFLPASFQYDPDRRERFVREARAASAVSSPNIAAIYDIGEHEGTSYIVMEYIEGEPLSKKIENGPLSINDSIDILSQAADALDEAHKQGIVHRDIKSDNIMITERGLVKILDFGLVKFDPQQDKARRTEGLKDSHPTVPLGNDTTVGIVVGTVAYMSPEQALGREVDVRTDIFSLGVVGYEMLTGRLPFSGNSPTEMIDNIVHQEPAAISRFNYNVPQELERIIRKAMEKDPDFRYQSAREMYIDLYNLRRSIESDARSTNLLNPNTDETIANKRSTGDIEPPAAAIKNAIAVMNFANITKEPADDWIGSGIAETVTSDLRTIKGLAIIGREYVQGMLRGFNPANTGDLDEAYAMAAGKRLGATWIIGGGFQRIGPMVRITARVVEVETGKVLKTVKLDGQVTEIFELQDKIFHELTQGMNLTVSDSGMLELANEETNSVEAYEFYSRAVSYLRAGSRDTLDLAISQFEKATEFDQNYARAWAGLGAAYDLKGSFFSVPELSERAVTHLQKAIQLQPKLAQAHQYLAGAYQSLRRYDEAIASAQLAIGLEPNNAGAHSTLSRILWLGKGMIDEAIKELQHSLSLNPDQGYAYLQLSLLHILQGDYHKAEVAARQAVELQEKFISGKEGLQVVGGHARLGYAFYRQGKYDEALAEYEKERDFLVVNDHALRERTLIELDQKSGAAHYRKGNTEQANLHLLRAARRYEERVVRGSDDPYTKYYIACAFAMMGNADKAIKLLTASTELLPAFNKARVKTDPDLEAIKDDPRFVELFKE
jgi:serine/threonine protein kinase/Flp pilus assembly protein TadD